jgi:16S rRNA (uracil1498-N3)-methyltransferase
MQRYFIRPAQMKDQIVHITGDDVNHIMKVMRSSVGDRVICCNGEDRCAIAVIQRLSKEEVECRVEQQLHEHRELPVDVTIAQALPKGDKMELVLQKATELGAKGFIPYVSARTIVHLDDNKAKKRQERWGKIVKEAAEQAHRSFLPIVHSIKSWRDLLACTGDYDVSILAYENENKQTLHDVLKQYPMNSRILLIIGPEGGFTPTEAKEALQHGMQSAMFGKRILRTETASLYGLSAISYYYELVGGN